MIVHLATLVIVCCCFFCYLAGLEKLLVFLARKVYDRSSRKEL